MRPRILVVAPGLRVGGVERSLLGLLHAMYGKGVDLSVFLHGHDGEWMDRIPSWVELLAPIPSYEALDRPIVGTFASGEIGVATARTAAKAVTRLRQAAGVGGLLLPRSVRYALPWLPWIPGRYDLALGFLAPHDVVLRRVRARRKLGWIHTDYSQLEAGVDLSFERRTWLGLDGLVAVSGDVARTFALTFDVPESRIRVVENVLDPEFVRLEAGSFDVTHEIPAKSKTLRVCSVGRFSHAKGFDLAIEACRRLVGAGLDVAWYLVGYGSEESKLRAQIARAGLDGRFVILGARANPYPYIAACDVYVQPSRYEGKAVTVREAQILGRPVLVSPYPTAASQVEDGVDGVVAEPGVDGLVRSLGRLVADPVLRARLSAATGSRDYGNASAVTAIVELAVAAAASPGPGT